MPQPKPIWRVLLGKVVPKPPTLAALGILFTGVALAFDLVDKQRLWSVVLDPLTWERKAAAGWQQTSLECRFEGVSLDTNGSQVAFDYTVFLSGRLDDPRPERIAWPNGNSVDLFPSERGPLGQDRYTATEARGQHLSVHIFRDTLDSETESLLSEGNTESMPFIALTDDNLPADGTGTFFTARPQPRLLTPIHCSHDTSQQAPLSVGQREADRFQLDKAWQLAERTLDPWTSHCLDKNGQPVCFHSLALPLSDSRFQDLFARMLRLNPEWGCPARRQDLSYLWLAHWTPDGHVAVGEMLIEAPYASDVTKAFADIFMGLYPIERMRPQDWFGGEDEISMNANNTSGFRCPRSDQGGEHPKGRAVDINPLVNPYIKPNEKHLNPDTGREIPPPSTDKEALARYDIQPARGWELAFLENRDHSPAQSPSRAALLITEDSAPVKAFDAIGWVWGGHWNCCADYQHFSENGY